MEAPQRYKSSPRQNGSTDDAIYTLVGAVIRQAIWDYQYYFHLKEHDEKNPGKRMSSLMITHRANVEKDYYTARDFLFTDGGILDRWLEWSGVDLPIESVRKFANNNNIVFKDRIKHPKRSYNSKNGAESKGRVWLD